MNRGSGIYATVIRKPEIVRARRPCEASRDEIGTVVGSQRTRGGVDARTNAAVRLTPKLKSVRRAMAHWWGRALHPLRGLVVL